MLGLEGRNSCQNGVTEQCEKGRSDSFEGNQFGSEEGRKDALWRVQTLWEHQQGVSKHLGLIMLCVLAASSFHWFRFVPDEPYKVLHDLRL